MIGNLVALTLRGGGWVVFAASLGAELLQLAQPRMDWLGVVVLWTLIASAVLHGAAGLLDGMAA
jgi:succinate dehydrogenase/fumarate reductase cytochrome b subunit